MSTGVTSNMIKQLNQDLDLDYSGDLKGYPFNEVLYILAQEYGTFSPKIKAEYQELKGDSSPVTQFKYVITRPGSLDDDLISFGFILESKNMNRTHAVTNGLRETLIDWREGFGIGYNKEALNKYIEENHFEPLLRRLG